MKDKQLFGVREIVGLFAVGLAIVLLFTFPLNNSASSEVESIKGETDLQVIESNKPAQPVLENLQGASSVDQAPSSNNLQNQSANQLQRGAGSANFQPSGE